MCRFWLLPFFVLSVFVGGMLLSGCEGDQGPQGPVGPTGATGPQGETGEMAPFISGVVAAPRVTGDGEEDFASAAVTVTKIPSLPRITINGFALGGNPESDHPLLDYLISDLPIIDGDNANLRVTYSTSGGDSALAHAAVIVPKDFEIFGNTQDIGYHDTLRLDWTAAGSADGYFVSLQTLLLYFDSTGAIREFRFRLDTVVADTLFEIPGGMLLPDSTITRGYSSTDAALSVSAVSGPVFPGDAGNVQGDGRGFFWGWNHGQPLSLIVDVGIGKSAGEAIHADPIRAFLKYRAANEPD